MTGGSLKKSKLGNNVMRFILVMAVLASLVSTGESYDFCTELDYLDTSNYTELEEQLQIMCQQNLDREEQELGTLSVEFMEDLSVFSATWNENETTALEYAGRIDDSYQNIIALNMNSSGVPVQVDSLYAKEIGTLEDELDVQDDHMANITSSIAQLEETERDLTASWQRLNIEVEYTSGIEQNLSRIFQQRTLESKDLESNLGQLATEYEQDKTRFKARVIPYLLFGIVLGSMIGLTLGLKWKKERQYWHAYSSSAKVGSPLKRAAILTALLLAALVFYLYISGIFNAIAAG
jgi:hypothetical protein